MMRAEPKIADRAASIMPAYTSAVLLLERLHRRLLDVIKDALDRAKADDINAVQALMLFNIGDQELTVSQLRERDYYTGSNSSYNVKKLVEGGFLRYSKSRIDRRCVRLSLGERGKEIHALVAQAYRKHAQTVEQLGGLEAEDFTAMTRHMARLDRFWADQIQYRL